MSSCFNRGPTDYLFGQWESAGHDFKSSKLEYRVVSWLTIIGIMQLFARRLKVINVTRPGARSALNYAEV